MTKQNRETIYITVRSLAIVLVATIWAHTGGSPALSLMYSLIIPSCIIHIEHVTLIAMSRGVCAAAAESAL